MKLISLLLVAAVIAAAIYFLLFKLDEESPAVPEPAAASAPAAHPSPKTPAVGGAAATHEPARTVIGKAYHYSKDTVEDSYSEHDAALDAVMNAQ
ncbi:MAG: hypothetical protein PHI85_02755 [Victivallaceae bacterium]|nr:hypothetical protein [Victivallaceae bacterium]